MNAELKFGDLTVGALENVFFSDHNGYALFHPAPALDTEPQLEQIRRLIAFSQDWNWRTANDDQEGIEANAEEWDAYLSLIKVAAVATLRGRREDRSGAGASLLRRRGFLGSRIP